MHTDAPYPELIVIDLDAILAAKECEPDYDAVEFGADLFTAPPKALDYFAEAAMIRHNSKAA